MTLEFIELLSHLVSVYVDRQILIVYMIGVRPILWSFRVISFTRQTIMLKYQYELLLKMFLYCHVIVGISAYILTVNVIFVVLLIFFLHVFGLVRNITLSFSITDVEFCLVRSKI
jgi:hypothetical protein